MTEEKEAKRKEKKREQSAGSTPVKIAFLVMPATLTDELHLELGEKLTREQGSHVFERRATR